jgi:hypothetical protein
MIMRRGFGKAAITVALLFQLETPDETLIGQPFVLAATKDDRTAEFCNRLCCKFRSFPRKRESSRSEKNLTADTAACQSAAAKA